MKLIFIAGSWCSGTTAVIGAIHSLGVPTFGPLFSTLDSRTPNSYELVAFRELVLNFVDEATTQHKQSYQAEFEPALKRFRQYLEGIEWPDQPDNSEKVFVLKMPLASVCLPEICRTFDTKVIVVHRPYQEIEASRVRRDWSPIFGIKGANLIYNRIFSDLIAHKLCFLGISYHDFINNTGQTLQNIIDFCEISGFHENFDKARSFIRSP